MKYYIATVELEKLKLSAVDPLFKLTVGDFLALNELKQGHGEKPSQNNELSQPITGDPTLDIDGATKLLKVSKQTIYQNIKTIPHRKIFGRLVFLREELLEFIDQNGNTDTRNKGDP